ncbi:aspartate/glutamate racemase family protein [Thermococcus chitonophagus]|uniref:aspartate/glutamate racemase family protein n=1 Tax=Thermococcus chitonophagus TaxID=54262 RepID=UPI001EF331BA|nr:aspartate/glutamate racemase family protein [Thermococcus chitonophagus]
MEDEDSLNAHGRLIERTFPELKVESRCIEDQPFGIYDKESEEKAKPKVIRLAKAFEKDGKDAVIISCAADPAVKELRKVLKIPVIGAGSSAALLALEVGDSVGVINLTEETPKAISEILGNHLVVEAKPKRVKNTLDLLKEESKEEIIKLAKEMEKDVDVIILGCTGMSTIGVAGLLSKRVNVPIVDPVVASGAMTLAILKNIDAWR